MHKAAPRINSAVLPLLGIGVFINYIDRGNLATAAPLMRGELHLSGTQIGLLMSAFFWVYVPAQILAGWLAERINAYRTLALGLALWSLATIGTGMVSGFAALIALRLLLGLGESATFPCMSKLLAQHVPPENLGMANGITFMGLGLGPAFGTFAGGMLMAQFGWRNVFLLFGVASLLWLLPWWAATPHATVRQPATQRGEGPSFAAILARRELWGTALGHFCGLYAFYFVLSWLPLYLVNERGFSMQSMARLGGAIYIVYAASIYLTGVIADRAIASGLSVNTVRKAGATISLSAAAISLVTVATGGPAVAVGGLFCAGVAFGLGSANVFTIPQTLAGPTAAGKWVAVQNCVGNFGGILAPIVTGMVIDRTGHFFWAFIAAACVSALGVLGWGVLVRRVEPLAWTEAA
jgi:MFS family permease